MSSWEDLRGEIFLHYISEDKTLAEVMRIMEEKHGVHYSKKQYKTKLGDWGYYKNNRRAMVMAILREKNQREVAGKDSEFYWQQRPVDMEDIERYSQRNKIQIIPGHQPIIGGSQQALSNYLVSRTPPPVTRSLHTPPQLRAPEKIFYDIDILVRGSFESGAWGFFDQDRLIESSDEAEVEQTRIMNFLGSVDLGCAAAKAGNNVLSVEYWQGAFLEVENLLKGAYHGIIPNIIIKLVDLYAQGFQDIAASLMRHISQLCLIYRRSNYPVSRVFTELEKVNLEQLAEVEDQIMTIFLTIFDFYVGSRCYSTFVMEMDRARRRLDRDESTEIENCLPSLTILDDMFGPTNCRPLDVLRLRVETLYQRGQYQPLIDEALALSGRAGTKHEDPWQRYYFLIKALYYSGSAHFYLSNYESARQSLEYALYLIEEFAKVDKTDQFRSERVFMLEKLEHLKY